MNVKLLRKVQKVILGQPARLMMDDYLERGRPGEKCYLDGLRRPLPPCGTVGCIAGWAVVLKANPTLRANGKFPEGNFKLGLAALDLSYNNGWLFMVSEWPWKFRDAWATRGKLSLAEFLKKRAKVVAAVIDYFIEHEGEKYDEDGKEYA